MPRKDVVYCYVRDLSALSTRRKCFSERTEDEETPTSKKHSYLPLMHHKSRKADSAEGDESLQATLPVGENEKGEINDVCSFYNLPSTILGSDTSRF